MTSIEDNMKKAEECMEAAINASKHKDGFKNSSAKANYPLAAYNIGLANYYLNLKIIEQNRELLSRKS